MKKIKSITRMPDFLLRMKGRLDSFRGETVIDSNIERFYDRLYAIEHDEATCSESDLHKVRMNAADRISKISTNKTTVPKYETTDSEVRKNNRLSSDISTALREIVSANEVIISGNVLLLQRIGKTRDLAEAKIQAYLTGVRCGKRLKDYKIKVATPNNHAVQDYEERHKELDAAVRSVAYGTVMKEVEG